MAKAKTDAQIKIELVAKAICESYRQWAAKNRPDRTKPPAWEDLSRLTQDAYRHAARAAIQALESIN